jgi:hypothetical protein
VNQHRKDGIHRRRFLNSLVGGLTAGGLAATVAAPRVEAAGTDSKSENDKRKSLYRVTNEVKTYYRVNSYPPEQAHAD